MEPMMADTRTTKSALLVGLLFASTVALVLTGCKAQQKPNAETSANTQQAAALDTVAEARKWGAQWALNNNVKLVTDCGALTDDEQRYGCADYVNHLPR